MKALWCLPILLVAFGCIDHDTDHLEKDAQAVANDAGKLAQSVAKDAGKQAEGLGLQASVHTVLWLRKGVDTTDLHVEARQGHVTLTGTVKDEASKQLIEDTVNTIKGVEHVDDRLVVTK